MAATATVVCLNDNSRPENTEAAGWFIRAAPEILQNLGVATVPVVVTAMILNRPLTTAGGAIVITYEAAKVRWVTPVIQKHEARGVAKGTPEANQRWEQSWERRQAAEARGEPFDEPPPSVSG